MRQRFLLMCCAAISIAALAGCGPVSLHPLSDESNSEIDERLIGVWRQKGMPGDASHRPEFTIGIAAGKERTHEAASVSLTDDREVKVERVTLWATKINGRTYLSVRLPNETPPNEKITAKYSLAICDVSAEGELQIALLNENAIATAIENKELAGTVTKLPPRKAGEIRLTDRKVEITAEPAALREFFAKRGKELFQTDSPTVFERADGANRE